MLQKNGRLSDVGVRLLFQDGRRSRAVQDIGKGENGMILRAAGKVVDQHGRELRTMQQHLTGAGQTETAVNEHHI